MDEDEEEEESSESGSSEGREGRTSCFEIGSLVVCIDQQAASADGRLGLHSGDILEGD